DTVGPRPLGPGSDKTCQPVRSPALPPGYSHAAAPDRWRDHTLLVPRLLSPARGPAQLRPDTIYADNSSAHAGRAWPIAPGSPPPVGADPPVPTGAVAYTHAGTPESRTNKRERIMSSQWRVR